jgi:hypothetical protein
MASKDDAIHAQTDNLLTCAGFITQPVGKISLSEQFCNKAMQAEQRPSYH